MNFGSVCSGIEAASVAWNPLGWRAQFVSEIDRFPCDVLEHHHGSVPNYGDMTKFKDWPNATIDVLVGGTPCQSFSVAGLRKGLDDPRGNLMLTYLAIAARYRPEWLVWENVPGVLSSNGGRDFGSFLGGLAELGYGFAYRVLDAQYFGLAQRRQRVFVVGCLGGWRRAAAVLFERASLRGDSAPRRSAGKDTTHELSPSIGASGREFSRAGETRGQDPVIATQGGVSHSLTVGGRFDYETETFVTHSLRADGFDAGEDRTGRGTPLTLAIRGRQGESTLEWSDDGVANAILTPNGGRGGIGVGAVAFNARQDPDAWEERTGPIDTNQSTQAVAFAQNQRNEVRLMDVAGALAKEAGMKQQTYVALGWQNSAGGPNSEETFQTLCKDRMPAVMQAMSVRRLTPRECEKLQGFPPDYTAITRNGKPAADGPRYKALGNSMAVPVMAWIGKRILITYRGSAP